MTPTPVVSDFAWRQIVRELDRVAPAEGLLVPLVALRPRAADANPCAMLELDAIAEVIIAAVLLVPRARQENRLARVSVLPETDDEVGRRIEAQVARFPRLRACAYLHSHPFATGRTAPSRGASGDVEGHMLPLWHRSRAAGLNTSFSFIACRGTAGHGWRLQGFAIDRSGRVVDLGFARVVANRGPEIDFALQPALDRQPIARALLRHWRRRQRRLGRRVRTDELFGGWRRLVARDRQGGAVVLLVPLDFPAAPVRRFLVTRRDGRAVERRLDGSWLGPEEEVLDERA